MGEVEPVIFGPQPEGFVATDDLAFILHLGKMRPTAGNGGSTSRIGMSLNGCEERAASDSCQETKEGGAGRALRRGEWKGPVAGKESVRNLLAFASTVSTKQRWIGCEKYDETNQIRYCQDNMICCFRAQA
jgi:hypothetical protein